MKNFHDMLKKKRDLHPSEKHAKMGVIKDLKSELSDSAGEKLGGLKKVSVMSNSPEGLHEGLDKAQQMVPQDDDSVPHMSLGGIAERNDDPSTGEPHEDSEPSPAEEELRSPHDDSQKFNMDGDDDSDMEHEYAEDMDLSEIKKHIAHLMSMQQKKESEG